MLSNYLSLVKFSHTIFALPFALIGYTLGVSLTDHSHSSKLLLLVLGCMVFARSAAMAFNRYLDRDIDVLNDRTKIREIPAGVISPQRALAFVILNCIAFVLCTWLINPLCFMLSPVVLFVILGYSYTKRFTSLCHLVLGLGLGLAPIGAYMAVTANVHISVMLFGIAVFLWVAGFDIIYAMQDEEFDRSIDLHSIPVRLGKHKAMNVSILLHILTALALIFGSYAIYPEQFVSQYLHIIGLVIFIGLLISQHLLVKPNDLSRVNLAFFTTNGVASVIFGVCVIINLLMYT